jgi:DNA-binding winged helix-turn-helix (wHTH) protein
MNSAVADDIGRLNREIVALRRDFADVKRQLQGSGVVTNHGKAFDIDESVRVSSILNRLTSLETTVAALSVP